MDVTPLPVTMTGIVLLVVTVKVFKPREVSSMIAKAFAMYVGGPKHKHTARPPRNTRRIETRTVRRAK
jgi:hypothetical protein